MTSVTTRLGVFALSLGLLVGAAGTAAADEDPIAVEFDFTYSSQYYWRGASAGPGSFAMPSVDVSYADGDLVIGANVWYAQGMEAGEADDNNEVDFTAYGGLDVGPLSISVGAIDYLIPLDAPFADGHVLEVFGAASLVDLPFDNSVQFSINIGDDNSWYLSPSIGHTHGDISCGLTVGIAGSSPNYYRNTDTAVVDITPSVSYAIPISDETEAAATLAIGYNPDAKVTVPFFTLGVGWSGI